MSDHKAIREALEAVEGQLGQPSLQRGHVIYAETEEWCSVDINVKLHANKQISGKLARFIKEAANPSALRALLADLDEARAALTAAKAGGWVAVQDCPDGDVWFALSCGHLVMGHKTGSMLAWDDEHSCCWSAEAIKAQPLTAPTLPKEQSA